MTPDTAADDALRASEERLRLALVAGDLGVWDADFTTGTVIWSGVARRQLGLAADAPATFETFLACVHPDDRARAREERARLRSAGESAIDFRVVWPDGSLHHLASRARMHGSHDRRQERGVGVIWDVTEATHSEASLRTREALLTSVLDHAPIVLFATDREGRFIARQGSTAVGQRQGTIGRSAFDVFANVPEIISGLRRALAGQAVRGEVFLRGRDFEFAYTPMLDADGSTVVGVTGVAADITERKRAEQAMLELQEHNRLLIDNASDVVVAYDVAGRLTFVNRRWEALTGYSVDKALSMSLQDVLHPEDRDWVFDTIRHCLEGEGVSTNHPIRICRSDGTIRWIDANVSVLRRGAEILGLEAFVRDITERVEAEAALRESEARKSAMLAGALDAIISTDDAGRITEFNPAAERMFGLCRHDVLGRAVSEVIVPARLRDAHGGGITDAAGNRRDLIGKRVETLLARADGSEFPAELAITEFRVDGRPAYTGFLRDISGRKRAEERLAHEATHDALTGLPNRALLRKRLETTLAELGTRSTSVALMLLDLDRFKEVNDTLGHVVGDLVLRHVAQRLSGQVRPEDTIARLGGDEFAIILPGAGVATAWAVARRLCAALDQPVEVDGVRLAVGASVGLVFGPADGDDAATLLRRADVAMYAAKRSGGGVSVYSSELDRDNLDRLALTSELREAIERGQLVLQYQPKVELTSRGLVGVEALVRWQHPRRGLLGPGEFIPLAEQTGLIEPLTRWVVRTARAQQAAWQADGLVTSVAVNLSMRSVRDPQLLDAVRDVLAAHSSVRGGFELELTESTLMADPELAQQLLSDFRALGLRIAVDDFGTGYSSLAYLKRLPLDELKIDRCFVQDLSSNTRDRALVKATIDLAQTLGLRVVAEGVEDAGSLQILERLGCDLVQGYHLSRPLPAEALRGWAADWARRPRGARPSQTGRRSRGRASGLAA